jgi:chromosome segregation ATPase
MDIDSLYRLRDARKSSGKRPRKTREKSADAEDLAALVRDLTSQLVSTSAEAAHLGTRLELTERAHSSLEEQAQALREERDRLRDELEAERSKGFWARLFGG